MRPCAPAIRQYVVVSASGRRGWARRGALVIVSLSAVLAPASAAIPARAATAWHTWVGAGTNVYRDSQYDRGEWIYSNSCATGRNGAAMAAGPGSVSGGASALG